jgi:uncharacterized membrane protein
VIEQLLQQCALAVGFSGVSIAMGLSFVALSNKLKRKYQVWFRISLALIGLATFYQIFAVSIFKLF